MYWSKSPKTWRNLGNLEQTVLRSAAVLNPYRNISSNKLNKYYILLLLLLLLFWSMDLYIGCSL